MKINLKHFPSGTFPGTFYLNNKLLLPERSQKIRNHSEDFSCGYSGSGPSQLALAVLLELAEDKTYAENNYQKFKEKIISALPKNTSFDVEIEIPSSYLGIIDENPFSGNDEPHIVSKIKY